MSDELRFDGRVAVVTGAGRGLGRAYAELLATRGADVVVNDIGVAVDGGVLAEDPAVEIVAGIVAAGGSAVADHHSVADEAGGAAIVDTALDAFGRVDILVNNAGAPRLVRGPEHLTDDILDVCIRSHLYGCFHTIRRAWPLMREQGYGRICNISSSTMLGVENSWDYPAAKGGIFALTRSLAIIGKEHGIAVNAMMPMAYTRPMHHYPNEQIRQWMEASFRAEQVAPAVAFLVHESVPCTGETLTAGAGRVARVVIAVNPGHQRVDGDLTIEDVAEHWDEIVDEHTMQVVRTSRDETALYAGDAAWHGGGLLMMERVVTDIDHVLRTTPSVRKRLDLTRPVPREVLEECLDLAVHAPNGSNQQPYRFLFVDDEERRSELARIYRAAMADFVNRSRTDAPEDNIDRSDRASARVTESVMHLAAHLHAVPVLCVPIVSGRTDGLGTGAHATRTNTFWQAGRWGSVIPALWSFMLALRARGLGSAWTTLTLLREREVADLLGIPYDRWMQVGLFPIAYTLGTDFAPTPRRPAVELVEWNSYGADTR